MDKDELATELVIGYINIFLVIHRTSCKDKNFHLVQTVDAKKVDSDRQDHRTYTQRGAHLTL